MGPSSHTPDDDARPSAGPRQAHRHGASPATAEELAAEDERARRMFGAVREELPTTWYEDDEE